jgi:endonuclease/exonuclease/phosphatase family metal-dependent hydrolase
MPFTLATFNVKDLFDAAPGEDAARAALDAKLANLAEIVARADADVLALQEVGSAAVLRALTARLDRGGGYGEPIVGTADARGIRCALLSRAKILDAKVRSADYLSFPVFHAGDPEPFGARIPLRRGIVHARVDAGAIGALDVLVAHFKSNRAVPLRDANGDPIAPATSASFAEGHLRSLVWRAAEALFVRGVVDELQEIDPERNIAVTGDLNDHPGSIVLRTVTGGGPRALQACADVVPQAARFSILRHGAPQQIDHILVTAALRKRVHDARFLNEALRDHGDFDFDEEQPPAPDSDHAAFVVSFA